MTVFHTPETLMSRVFANIAGDLVSRKGRTDAGVGDDDVEPAVLGDTGLDEFAHRVQVTDVAFGGEDAPAQGFDEAGGFFQVFKGGGLVRDVRKRAAEVQGQDVSTLLYGGVPRGPGPARVGRP
jgi:hypothetical protein